MQDILTVSDLNNYIKGLLESDFFLSNFTVRGEITNFKQYKIGGQWYFTLKDNETQINCVVFQNYHSNIRFEPQDGDEVVIKGRVSVFNKRGTYNIQVFWMEPLGLGDLAKAFEKLKNKLDQEGLFAADKKKPLPKYPQKIAVLSAAEGAAVHDVIDVAKRRDPGIEIVVLPTIVQGTKSAASIIKNIILAQKYDFDVIILARGGGSMEDLWSFNEESVARAIYASKTPIVSAVGHEIDFTIADFVADLRAATPSVAAEIVVPDYTQLRSKLNIFKDFLISGMERLSADQYQNLDYFIMRMTEIIKQKIEKANYQLRSLVSQLESLNPIAILSRGYAVVEKNEKLISSVKQLSADDIIKILFKNGSIKAKVTSE